jgi:hypothetical protein
MSSYLLDTTLAYRLRPLKIVRCRIMALADKPSKTIGELIDDADRIREDLFRLQRELEKLESLQSVASTDERKEA